MKLYGVCLIFLLGSMSALSMDPFGFMAENYMVGFYRQPCKRTNSVVFKDVEIPMQETKNFNKQDSSTSSPICQPPLLTPDVHKQRLHNMVTNFCASNQNYGDLIKCIDNCNNAKQYGITEDDLGAFAFKYGVGCKRQIAPFFYFLKYYNQQSAIKQEVPFKTYSALAKRLNIVSKSDALATSIEVFSSDCKFALGSRKISDYFLSLIHSDKKCFELTNDCRNLNDGWKRKFLFDALRCVGVSRGLSVLYDVVVIVNKAKEQGLIKKEYDLGYDALFYELTCYDIFMERHVLENLPMGYGYDYYKKQIALLCSFIKKYNDARGEKITPSMDLYYAYQEYNVLHMLLPDVFDADLFNPEKIAFAEYAQLINDINFLKNSDSGVIAECVKELYPSKRI